MCERTVERTNGRTELGIDRLTATRIEGTPRTTTTELRLTLSISLHGDTVQVDGLHCGHIAEAHFRDVERAHHMRPSGRVCLFEGAGARGTQFTSYAGTPLLAFALSTEPRPSGHTHDAVARLVDGHIAVAAIAVDERILRPPPLVRTYTTASDHLLHAWRRPLRNLHTPVVMVVLSGSQ